MNRIWLIVVALSAGPVLAQESAPIVELAEDLEPPPPPLPPPPKAPETPAVLAPGISAIAVDPEGPALEITTPSVSVVAGGVELAFDTNAKARVAVESTHVYGAEGAAPMVLRPGQWATVEGKMKVVWDAVPLSPDGVSPPGTRLQAAPLESVPVGDLLSAVASFEGSVLGGVAASMQQVAGEWAPKEGIADEDLALSRWVEWSTAPDGTARGRIPLDVFRFALWAVTANFTVLDITDWIRSNATIDMKEAVTTAQSLVSRVVVVLARAGFEHRVVSVQFPQFSFNRGVAAYERGDFKGAVHHLERAIARERTLMAAHYNLGITYYRAGRLQDAADAFLVATGFDAASADVFFNRGATLYRLGDLLGAARAFRKVLALTPDDEESKTWLQKADPEGKTAPPPPKKKKKRRRRRRRRK